MVRFRIIPWAWVIQGGGDAFNVIMALEANALDYLAAGRASLGVNRPKLGPIAWHRLCILESGMRYPILSRAFILLIFTAGLMAYPASGCGLDHCPRPKLLMKERPSIAWGLEHTRLGQDVSRNRYTQSSLHLRLPQGSSWIIGGHLPFGYLQTGTSGHWGLANPVAYAEWMARPKPTQSLTMGMQLELPLGDDESGIASGHAMAMPYLLYSAQGRRVQAQASVGFMAQISGGHPHTSTETEHSLHDGSAASGSGLVEANPHEPYEFVYRFTAALPVERFRIEPEVGISGARVLFPEGSIATDFVSAEAALGLKLTRTLVLKPRWEQQLTHPGRFAWSTGLDVKFEIPVY